MKLFLTHFLFALILPLALHSQQSAWPELDQLEKQMRQYELDNDYDKILSMAPALQQRARKAQAWPIYCSALSLEGEAHKFFGDYEKAGAITSRAVKETEQYLGKKHLLYATALFNRARFLDDAAQRDQPLDSLFLTALAIFRDTIGTNNDFYAATLNGYGIYKQEVGDIEQAEDLLWQSIDILEKVDTSKESYVVAIGNLAVFLADIGKTKEAENLYLRTISLSQEIFGDNYSGKGIDLNNLGSLYIGIDEFSKAEQYLKAAISADSAELGYSHHYCRMTRANLLVLYARTKKYKEVQSLALQLLSEKMPAANYNIIRERVLPSLLGAYIAQKDFARATQEAHQYLQIVKTQWGENSYRLSRVYNEMISLYTEQAQFDSAYHYAQLAAKNNAIAHFPQPFQNQDYPRIALLDYQDPAVLINTLDLWLTAALSNFLQNPNTQNKDRVLGICHAALAFSDRRRKLLIDEDNQLAQLAANQMFIAGAVSVLIASNTPQEQSQAFDMVEQNKALLLAAALQSRNKTRSEKVPQSLITLEKNLKAQITTSQAKQLEASGSENKKIINQQLAQLNLQYEALQKQIRQLDTAYYDQQHNPKTLSLPAAQASLPNDALLLEFFITDAGVFLFALSNQQFKATKIKILKDDFKEKINRLRKEVSDMNLVLEDQQLALQNYNQIGYEIYQLLLQPTLEQFPNTQKLIIVPDRQLWNIPFEALLTKLSPNPTSFKNLPYLVRDYEISYAYSATLLAENQTAFNNLNPAPQTALLLAADYSLPIPTDKNGPMLGKKIALRRALAPLPAAQNEVQTIAQILNTTPLNSQTSGEAAFKKQAPNYNIIHLAMHGIVDEKYPELSSLAFSEIGDQDSDNFLQAHEISKLQLRARLVVLSACETGSGRFAQGEGNMSLGRAFMYAGVPSLVISLWPVNDGATASLMKLFYTNIQQGQTPAQALRNAKIDYLHRCEGVAGHPVFWAPFVQLGANQPILPQQSSNWLLYLAPALAFGAVLAIYTRRNTKK